MEHIIASLKAAESTLGDRVAVFERGRDIVRNALVRIQEQETELKELERLNLLEAKETLCEALVAFLKFLLGDEDLVPAEVPAEAVSKNGFGEEGAESTSELKPKILKHGVGVDPKAVKIMRLTVVDNKPQTFEEVMEVVYGLEWETREISKTVKGKRDPIRVTLGDDLQEGDESVMRKAVAGAVQRLDDYTSDRLKKHPTGALVNLVTDLNFKQKRGEIFATVRGWGIQVD